MPWRGVAVQVVLCPVNIGGVHWVLMAVYPCRGEPTRKIVVFDSMAGNEEVEHSNRKLSAYRPQLRALEMALAAVENRDADALGLRMRNVRPWKMELGVCPQQNNGDDCGVMAGGNGNDQRQHVANYNYRTLGGISDGSG
jgi:Ulp1 family protease